MTDTPVIPADIVSCPQCGSDIAMTDTLEDTCYQQARTWVCLSPICCATGWIALTITCTREKPTSAPPQPVIRPRSWRDS